ncbi:sulfite exporter TauE/SafE family protein [Asaia prunellae]|uniref:sulfite exporter TauE/SafE family protein n=1 Tax=Asaia prunellae TaxID=610245 RepID=UPI00046EE1B2|nr:sulfite exporter TauE/SafE family protein [Asaia prunellae]
MLVFVLLFCLSCGAFTISAVAGGGAGLVIMPVLGLLLTASKIPAALSLGTMCSTIGRIATFRHAIDWRVVSCFLPAALPAAALGVFCLRLMPPVYLEMFLGLFLSGNVVLLLRPASPVMTDQGAWKYLPAIGLAAGFISGFTGATGLLFNRFYQKLGLQKETIIATRAANEVLLHAIKLFLYARFGLFDGPVLVAGLCVGVSALAALRVTKIVLPLLSHAQFCRIGHAAAALAGLFMLGNAAHQIVQKDAMSFRYGRFNGETELAMTWRSHRLALEIERPLEIEVKHRIAGFTDPHTGLAKEKLTVLHLAADRGVFVTHREFMPDPGHHRRRHHRDA